MTIKDILKFGGLEDAEIIAGREGINNKVTSISVLEVAEEKIKNWVLADQLYITSFYAILQDIDMQKKVISALYEKKAAGLVICHVDLFLKEVHPDIIRLCNELGFPIILANSKRSYIEILNPILLKFMESSGSEINNMNNIQNKLIEYIATKRDMNYIYKSMAEEYGGKIIFLDINNSIIYPKYDRSIDQIVDAIENNKHLIREEYREKGYYIFSKSTKPIIIFPIQCNDLEFGTIIAEIIDNDLHSSIKKLNSISSLCTLISTKSSRIKEIEIARKQEYISDLITWNFRTDEVAMKMGQDIGWDILNKSRMIIVNLNDVQENLEVNNKDLKSFIGEILYGKIKNLVRNNNERNLIGLRSDIFLILLEDYEKDSYKNAKKIGFNILECCNESFKGSVSIGISGEIQNYKDIPEAYTQATDAAKIGRYFLGDNKVVCFDDMGFYGVFREIMNVNKFNSISNDIFKELRQYDDEENLDLYNTLKALVYNNMNTEKTAEQLYVHRNTINYRKKRIVEILGYEPWNMPYLLNTIMVIVSEYFK